MVYTVLHTQGLPASPNNLLLPTWLQGGLLSLSCLWNFAHAFPLPGMFFPWSLLCTFILIFPDLAHTPPPRRGLSQPHSLTLESLIKFTCLSVSNHPDIP